MDISGWLILLVASAAVATAAQLALFSRDRKPTDYDWVYIAGGGLVGGFTGHAWYPGFGPVAGGLNVAPALAGLIVGAILLEVVYRAVLRPRQSQAPTIEQLPADGRPVR